MGAFNKIPEYVDNLNTELLNIVNSFIGDYLTAADNEENPDPFAGIEKKEDMQILLLKIRGVILVSHAEIQSFLEFIGKTYIKEAHQKYQQGQITEMFLFFSTTSNDSFPGAGKYYNPTESQDTSGQDTLFQKYNGIEERYQFIYHSYCDNLKHNYGVKERNIFMIFNPLGVTYDELKKMKLFSLIHEYGNIRGDFAHEAIVESKYLPGQNALEGRILDVKKTSTMITDIVKFIREELLPILDEKLGVSRE